MRCPTCKKENTFRPWVGMTNVRGIEIEGHGRCCGSCGEILIRLTELERQERLVAKQLVARGVRTGGEFKFVRKAAGLRATEVADMFGVRKETVSRWERDEVPIPRTAAFALGALFEHPKLTRQRLEAFAYPLPQAAARHASG